MIYNNYMNYMNYHEQNNSKYEKQLKIFLNIIYN